MMKQSKHVWALGVSVITTLGIAASPAMAADRYSSGTKTWDTTTDNWGDAPGVCSGFTWDNAAPDSAFLEGTGGTVTLGEAITNQHLNVSADNYTITGNSLHFPAGGAITNTKANLRIRCAITGSPSVTYSRGNNQYFYLEPTAGSMTLGTIYRRTDDYLVLGGTTVGNSVAEMPVGIDSRAKVRKVGSGTWTLGDAYGNEFYISDGNLIANGEITTKGRFDLNGGVLHYNNAGAFGANATTLYFNGGDLDNSSGLALTASYAVPMTWRADWTFIGSQGVNSDLNLGTAAVTLAIASPAETFITLTVSNLLTTLTIGGAIGDGGNGDGLNKSGAGTLELMANNTYSGDTIASEGILDVRVASSLANSAAIQIDSSGTLRLENADNGGSVWDFAALSALNPNLRAGLDPGTAGNLNFAENVAGYTDVTATPPNPDRTAYWDGNDTSGAADGGAGTWDNTASNWDDAATGGSPVAWDADNTDNDTAVFGGSGGKVELGADIALRRMEVNSANYQIGSDTETHVLNFGSVEPRITFTKLGVVKAGITGSPAVVYQEAAQNRVLLFAPTDASMALGTVTRLSDDQVHLGGSSTGNTVEACPRALVSNDRSKVLKVGSGTWTCHGELYGGSYYWIQGGTLIVNGLSHARGTTDCRLYAGATLVANGTLEDFVFYTGGTLRGTGVVNQALSVTPTATLAPGYPTGTLTITNNPCTINGTLAIEIDSAQTPTHGTLAVDGTLDISNATLDVNVTSSPGGTMIIATYETLTGTEFSSVTGWPSASIDYEANGGTAIALLGAPAGTLMILR